MDVRFINPLLVSVNNVFTTVVETDISVGKPYVVQSNQEPSADVSAVIGLSGDAVGCMVLSFPMTTAVDTASKFAGVAMTMDHAAFADALGELANMVASQAKGRFEGLKVNVSLPSVIVGKEHVVSQSKQAPRLALPCDSDLGQFWVEMALVVEKQSAAATQPVAAGVKAR